MPNDTPPRPPGPQPPDESELQVRTQEATGTILPTTTTEFSSTDISEESDAVKRRRAWHNTALKQRLAFLIDLMKRFDTLIYAEIAFLYYLEYASLFQPTIAWTFNNIRPELLSHVFRYD